MTNALESVARGELPLREALGLSSESVEAARALAAHVAAAGRPDLARVLLEGVVALEPTSSARMDLARLMIRAGEAEQAWLHARRALESGPPSERSAAAFLAARACLSLGRLSEVGGYVRKAREQAGGHPPVGLRAFSERLARR